MKIRGKLVTEVDVDHKDLANALKRAIFIELDLPRYNKVHHDGISFIEKPFRLSIRMFLINSMDYIVCFDLSSNLSRY